MVATYHLDWPDSGLLLFLYHTVDRIVLRRFRRVVAVSEHIRQSLLRAGLRADRVCEIANGTDLEPFRIAGPKTSARTNVGRGPVIGVVGRLALQKGHRFLIEGAPAVLREFPDAIFLFVGDGPERDRLGQMTRSLGIQDRVIFAGVQSDMPSVYSSMDILVLPSINEGLPMTLIEALAARKPIVASDVGDVRKVIRDGETGLLVKPGDPQTLGDAVLRFLRDADLRESLSARGQQWTYQQFSASRMADEYRAVYNAVLREVANSG
jgi:glycosyltransferase involved in cell wall biosynthesis